MKKIVKFESSIYGLETPIGYETPGYEKVSVRNVWPLRWQWWECYNVLQECCHCCNVGIIAHEAALPCSLMVRFGPHCDDAFRECCDNGRRLPPPTTSTTSLLSNTSDESTLHGTSPRRRPPATVTPREGGTVNFLNAWGLSVPPRMDGTWKASKTLEIWIGTYVQKSICNQNALKCTGVQ